MRTEITATHYNVTAIIGWFGLLVGLMGCAVQYFAPSVLGFVFLAIGTVGGGVTIAFAGPWRTIERRTVDRAASYTVPD